MAKKYLRGAAYALGEERRSYTDIVGFERAAQARKLPILPEILGFGAFSVTRDVYQCASISVGKSLALAKLTPSSIDQVIFCSSSFKERTFSERNVKVGKLLKNWDIAPQRISGVSGSGCTDVLSSIDIACATLDLRSAHNVLIVAVEAFSVENDSERVLSHALISDAAVSMVVSDRSEHASTAPEWEIMGCEIASDVGEIGGGMSITQSSPNRDFIRNAVERAGSKQTEIAKIFGNNVYLPIKTGREGVVGFSRSQMYLENVRRTGHCLGCDSIINLVDFGRGEAGSRYVLYAEAEGHRGCATLLRGPVTSS
jgi:3-oxoacyl-[acyl-carrier-protein] synthase-3